MSVMFAVQGEENERATGGGEGGGDVHESIVGKRCGFLEETPVELGS